MSSYSAAPESGLWPRLVVLALMLPWLNPLASNPLPVLVMTLLTLLALGALLMLPLPKNGASVLLRVLAHAWLWAALLSSVIGLVQVSGAGEHLAPWVAPTMGGEVYANLGQRNLFASLTQIGLLALIWLAGAGKPLGSGTGRSFGPLGRRAAPALLAAALLGAGTGISASRTGLLQYLLLLLLWLVVWRRSRAPSTGPLLLAAGLGFALAVLLLGENGLFGRLTAPAEQACLGRRVLWANVLHLIAQRPFIGWGWGDLLFTHFTTLYPGERFCDMPDNAHNLPLHLAVSLGVPLALAVCGLLALLVWRARPWAEVDSARQLAWAVLAVIGVHSLLEFPLWYPPFQLAAGGCIVALWLTGPAMRKSAKAGVGRSADALYAAYGSGAGFAVRLLAAGALVGAALVTAKQYAEVLVYYPPPSLPQPVFAEGQVQAQARPLMFGEWVDLAEVVHTPVTERNAERMLALSEQVLHTGIGPVVIEKLLRSAVLLRRYDVAVFYLDRYKASFPKEYADWEKRNEKK